jgi:DNA-binding IclR family transcriptional regulator
MTTSDRLLAVLDLFDIDCPDWSVEEAATALKLATSTTYRYFSSLTASGMIAPCAAGRYVLGPTIIRYDRLLRLTDPLISATRFEMHEIAKLEPGKTVVFVCRLLGRRVMCVAQASTGDLTFEVGYERGRLMPLFRGSASKVILALLSARQLRSLYRREAESFSESGLGATWEEVRDALRNIRLAGFLISNGEIDQGMRGISVPLFVEGGSLFASLTVAGPAHALGPVSVARITDALEAAAPRIIAAMHSGAPQPSIGLAKASLNR